MKKIKCTVLILIALFVWALCLAKYLDPQSGFAVNGISSSVSFKLPYLPHISSVLNGSLYQFGIYNGCTVAFLAVLFFGRIVLLRNLWQKRH